MSESQWETKVSDQYHLMRRMLGCAVSGGPVREHREEFEWCASAWCLVKVCEQCAGAVGMWTDPEKKGASSMWTRRRMWCEAHAGECLRPEGEVKDVDESGVDERDAEGATREKA